MRENQIVRLLLIDRLSQAVRPYAHERRARSPQKPAPQSRARRDIDDGLSLFRGFGKIAERAVRGRRRNQAQPLRREGLIRSPENAARHAESVPSRHLDLSPQRNCTAEEVPTDEAEG